MGHLAVEPAERVAALRSREQLDQAAGSAQHGFRVATAGRRQLGWIGRLEGMAGDGPQELVAGRTEGAPDLDEAGVDEAGDDLERVGAVRTEIGHALDQGQVRVGDHDREGDRAPADRQGRAGRHWRRAPPTARPGRRPGRRPIARGRIRPAR